MFRADRGTGSLRRSALIVLLGVAIALASPSVALAHQINMSVVRDQARKIAEKGLINAVDADYFRIACNKYSSHRAYCRTRFYGGSVGYCYNVTRFDLRGNTIYSRLDYTTCP